jgi:DHA2 family multidrug resistance protein-like MFS transporter
VTTVRGRRLPLPKPIDDVVGDRPTRPILVGAALAMAAVGLDPPILEPAMPSIQAAVRAEPELQSLLLVTAVWKSAVLLAGGVIADVFRSRRLYEAGLLGLVAASVLATVIPDESLFFLFRLMATLSVGLVLPYAIGVVGVTYGGIRRATAIGIAYAAFGAGAALAPALALLNGAQGPYTPAFIVCAAAALLAFFVNRRLMPAFARAPREQRRLVVSTALWGFGVIALVAALINFRIDPLDVLVGGSGVAAIIVAIALNRRPISAAEGRIDRRLMAIVLGVGIVIGFAQIVPLLKMPQFFTLILGLPPLLATLAIAPFALALLVAGPLSGWLLRRIEPRVLVAGGVVAVGVADLALAAVLWPDSSYLLFILPFALIGAGFVLATVVRTALIFASVPRQLPSSAAGLNEASLGLGNRLGAVFSAFIATEVALSTYAAGLVGRTPEEIEQALAPLRELLFAIGLPAFPELLDLIDPAIRTTYGDAFLAGMRASLIVPGVLAIIAGVIAYILLGKRDPLMVVFDYSNERSSPNPAEET